MQSRRLAFLEESTSDCILSILQRQKVLCGTFLFFKTLTGEGSVSSHLAGKNILEKARKELAAATTEVLS